MATVKAALNVASMLIEKQTKCTIGTLEAKYN